MHNHVEFETPLTSEDKSEIEKIKKSYGKGGLYQDTVLLALKHLFSHNKKVYIPSINSLSGVYPVLPLETLQSSGYDFVGFSFATENKHQIAVWVDLTKTPYKVLVFDSKTSVLETSLPFFTLNQLKNLLGHDVDSYDIKMGASPYVAQDDNWSCGVYVIAHLLSASKQELVSHKTVLPVESLVENYYVAYKNQLVAEEKIQQEKHVDESYKRQLLEILKSLAELNFAFYYKLYLERHSIKARG